MMLLMLGMVSSLPTLIGFGQEESHPTCKYGCILISWKLSIKTSKSLLNAQEVNGIISSAFSHPIIKLINFQYQKVDIPKKEMIYFYLSQTSDQKPYYREFFLPLRKWDYHLIQVLVLAQAQEEVSNIQKNNIKTVLSQNGITIPNPVETGTINSSGTQTDYKEGVDSTGSENRRNGGMNIKARYSCPINFTSVYTSSGCSKLCGSMNYPLYIYSNRLCYCCIHQRLSNQHDMDME